MNHLLSPTFFVSLTNTVLILKFVLHNEQRESNESNGNMRVAG